MDPPIFSYRFDYHEDIIDKQRCFEFTYFFGDESYDDNDNYNRCMNNWCKYIEYEGDEVSNMELMFEWEETCLKDFLKGAKEWLWNNKHWSSEELV